MRCIETQRLERNRKAYLQRSHLFWILESPEYRYRTILSIACQSRLSTSYLYDLSAQKLLHLYPLSTQHIHTFLKSICLRKLPKVLDQIRSLRLPQFLRTVVKFLRTTLRFLQVFPARIHLHRESRIPRVSQQHLETKLNQFSTNMNVWNCAA